MSRFLWYLFMKLTTNMGSIPLKSIHINRLCRDCYYQLRQLCVIARSLTSTATATLVHTFVTSRLDYCSTLYVGLPAVRLGCLERVIALRSSEQGLLFVPLARTSTTQARAFSVVGPRMEWASSIAKIAPQNSSL